MRLNERNVSISCSTKQVVSKLVVSRVGRCKHFKPKLDGLAHCASGNAKAAKLQWYHALYMYETVIKCCHGIFIKKARHQQLCLVRPPSVTASLIFCELHSSSVMVQLSLTIFF